MSDPAIKSAIAILDPVRKGWTSASGAPADALCAGRHIAQRNIPEPERGEYALHGDLIHQMLAGFDENGDRVILPSLDVTVEQRDMFDACRKIEKELVTSYFGKGASPMKVFRHERKWVQFTHNGKTLLHSGEADVVYRVGTRLLISDYKTLLGDHAASSRNLQLRDLAVLFWGALRPISEVATAVIQPLVTHSPELTVYTAEDLVRSQQEMFLRIAASNSPDSSRTPGKVQCDYCRAKRQCKEYQGWAGAILPPHLQLKLVLDTPMEFWTPDQRTLAADYLSQAFDLLDFIKDSLKEGIAKDPNFAPGWMLAPGNIRETIAKPQECFDRFQKLGGTLEQFLACISVGKTKLTEQVSQTTGQKGMELVKTMKALTDGIVEVSQNSPSLKKVKE